MVQRSARTQEASETAPATVMEAMTGPGDPNGLRVCLDCLQEFGEGDRWLKLTPVAGEYSTGLHVACYLRPVD